MAAEAELTAGQSRGQHESQQFVGRSEQLDGEASSTAVFPADNLYYILSLLLLSVTYTCRWVCAQTPLTPSHTNTRAHTRTLRLLDLDNVLLDYNNGMVLYLFVAAAAVGCVGGNRMQITIQLSTNERTASIKVNVGLRKSILGVTSGTGSTPLHSPH